MDQPVNPRLSSAAVKFLIAGGLATAINWLVRFPLSIVLPFSAAVAIAYMIGMVAGFLLYSRWVFPPTSIPLASQIGRFIAVNIAGGVAVVILAPLLARSLESGGFDQGAAQAIGHGLAIAIGAVINYFGHKLITFADPAAKLGD
ncbi:MAG: GtrA family protein [Methylovirgula sp.]